jgi:hypothetical protein
LRIKVSSWLPLQLPHIHIDIPALDSELLASTSKKQRWRNSTLRETCRAAFRYRILIEEAIILLILSLDVPKLKGSSMANRILKISGRKRKISPMELWRSKFLLKLRCLRILCL